MIPTTEKFIPIYKRIFAHYQERILDGRLKEGERIESIAEMQVKFEVGRETAKQALKLLAEEGLIFQFRGKGSFVADIGPRHKIWGLVFPFFSIQYDDLIQKLSVRAKALGRELLPRCDYNDWREEVRLVGEMLRDRYEAVLVVPTLDESKTWEYYSSLSPRNERVILVDHTMTSNDFRWVIQSYDLGVMLAFNYLREQKGGGVAFIENETWSGRNMVMDLMRLWSDGESHYLKENVLVRIIQLIMFIFQKVSLTILV